MNQRERLFEANKDLIEEIEELYGRIATDVQWDDNSEPYTYLCGRMKVGSNDRNARLAETSIYVMFFQIYSDGEFVEEENYRADLQFELDHIKKFLEENSNY
jgi:hypothetical protein